ncbi:hypothetical protein [Acinetobacter sp. BSP-53]
MLTIYQISIDQHDWLSWYPSQACISSDAFEAVYLTSSPVQKSA